MHLLDTAAAVAALAASTGRPHMSVRADARGVALLRLNPDVLDAVVVDRLGAEGQAIVSHDTQVEGALVFWETEQALLSRGLRGVSLTLVQPDGRVRTHEGVDAPVLAMPIRAAA